MSKPNKDGWIRHHGGNCPVEAGVRVEYRMRDGSTRNSVAGGERLRWTHESYPGDIMAYRMHKPAEQPEIEPSNDQEPDPQADSKAAAQAAINPLEWRDRITEIDATVEALEEERASLVQRLEAEGFRLIERTVQPVEDMSDWRNWREGDIIQCLGESGGYTDGKTYEVKSVNIDRAVVYTKLDDKRSKTNGWSCDFFKFHSRPSK